MAEESNVVLLGVVQADQRVDDGSPYVCKAGGQPAWYTAGGAPMEAESLHCPKCSQPLFLVAQVYAPVDADRTLYVFGCNSFECTETPGSWRVLRDQVGAEAKAVAAPRQPVEHTPMPAAVTGGGWAATDGDSSDWSDDDDDDGVSEEVAQLSSGFSDLELLLQQRDDALAKPSLPAAPAKPAVTKKALPNEVATSVQTPAATQERHNSESTNQLNAFPAVLIDVTEEPYEDYTKENDFSHENELLQAYIKQEEEDKSTDVGDLRRILATASGKKNSGQTAATATGAKASGESYERTPAQQKHFIRFQKRISRSPWQVLRYDYGGAPLWPMPVPRAFKVPACVCGEDRSFEMQLTPTINYFLKVDDYAIKHTSDDGTFAMAEANMNRQRPPGGGMDWASVLIFSCPKSCPQSQEEFVYVLPAHPEA